ncbi:hypothetical protein BU14_0502s0014 [Porphyra umbilicalis]|uniref:guanylate kinase n=1 Tax=Porphyra umbilicalis TaxID=2786 RepID=A0A1X6NTF0_PORUM|nr:hypothetical protein BU14_0502s0014 [Porphyra umbilicalis]|eukprot:OSX71780.1 hypothetical protein BU14_0502s0014 [Porphyra umbilicalis]
MVGPRAVVLAGPSGVGKGTLISRLQSSYPSIFGFSVSHTTRPPRAAEVNGTHYHFATEAAFVDGIAGGKFLEHANVHGKYYGTSLEAVEQVRASGKICILDIDVQGCRLVRKAGVPALFVFVAPPSMEELGRRLRGRGTEDEEAIAGRLVVAETEMAASKEPGLFDTVIVNDNLDAAFDDLVGALKADIAVAEEAAFSPKA